MSYTRLNLGLSFAQPFESNHAMLRRFLIANIGIPLTTLERLLREQVPGNSGIIGRIFDLQPSSIKIQTEYIYDSCNIYRQCPQCAVNFYHSDIYHLPWLKCCPIHHCAFTSRCPICEQRWPDKFELATRDCPCCGRPGLDALNGNIRIEINKMNYQPIADIYDFIQYKQTDDVSLMQPRDKNYIYEHFDWWNSIDVSNPLFPGIQVRNHPDFTKTNLKSLHIESLPVHRKHIKLVPLVNFSVTDDSKSLRYGYCLDLNKASQTALRSDYLVMRRIIRWTSEHTNKNHKIHIASYRFLSVRELLQGPPPCLFCMALSLWFFYTASKRYGYMHRIDAGAYVFCDECRYYNFLNASETSILIYNKDKHYTIEDSFVNWLYRRGLEVSFIDIINFISYLLEQLDIANCHYKKYSKRSFSDQNIFTNYTNGKLFFYYEYEHPLEKLKLSRIENNDKFCKKHRRFLNKDINVIIKFDADISPHEFTYNAFLSLHNKFRTYLDYRL